MAALRGDSPVQYIKGVGPARAELFAKVGIHTVSDLLEYFPFRHEPEALEVAIEDLRPGMNATVRGEVLHIQDRRGSQAAEIHDGTGSCTLRWFNLPYALRGFHVGAMVVATGKTQVYNDDLEMVQPRVQVFAPETPLLGRAAEERRLVGVYRGNEKLKSLLIRRAVESVLQQPQLPVDDLLPDALKQKHRLMTRADAIRRMHLPETVEQVEQARRRLAYEEFLLLELAIAIRRHRTLQLQKGLKMHATREIDERIRARFPFALTASQDSAVREIARDLSSGRPMTRLLQGDVGSGKTVVALYACLVAIANGKQAAIMAPTEILATQHHAGVERYLRDSRVRFELLRGGQRRSQRAERIRRIEAGEVDLVIGTQALLQKDVDFKQLGLVVVDEQHKFGVVQRADFRTKGPLPHYLVMTATPIPRTLSMTIFGDLDVSIIREAPPGRGTITTKVVHLRQWPTVMEYVRKRLEKGEQAYVVCPLIGPDGGEGPRASAPAARRGGPKSAGLVSVKEAFERLTGGPWRGLSVGLLHGGMKSAEKERVIRAFAQGDLNAVVATTVVEVGIDVPNATIMIVEHAERFGLSQLHQLRGRVGRGPRDSLCVYVSHDARAVVAAGGGNATSSVRSVGKAGERLSVLAETTDGFRIAEADLRQRGPGELLGTRQHGLPELRTGDLVNDFGLLEQARQDAFQIVADDPQLQNPQNRPLIAAMKKLFGGRLSLIDAA